MLAIIDEKSYDTEYPSERDELVEKIERLPALDVAPVVHEKDIRSSIITVENVDEWQGRIILADDGTRVCAVYYADGDDCVPVVRCRDCKYAFQNNGHDKEGCPIMDRRVWMDGNSFCSEGKRMDGEAE